MKNIRLLPVVVLAISALLVLKTIGLVTNGGYVLTGTSFALAAGGGNDAHGADAGAGENVTLATDPTVQDTAPTLADTAPTIEGSVAEHGGNGPASEHAVTDQPPVLRTAVVPLGAAHCFEANASVTEAGEIVMAGDIPEGAEPGAPAVATAAVECLPSGDSVPQQLTDSGATISLTSPDAMSMTEQQLLARLSSRREELAKFEQDLALRASLVDAAEKRIEERATTLEALEAQIAALVDKRTEMESGQFAGIVAMYEAMKPKDAATIFNNLDMGVLLRVAKTMSPRKMAPILAEMTPPRAQELTVAMAALADAPATQMTSADLAALPQIVGQ